MSPRVLVSIVTYNSGPHLDACLRSLRKQTFRDFAVSLWDNASADETLEVAASHSHFLQSEHFSTTNVGFCAAHNKMISSEQSDYVLVLNPDAWLEPDFLEIMVHALDRDAGAGSATGKLWRAQEESGGAVGESPPRVIDTTGIYFLPNQRHLDRGSGEMDRGQYDRREYVFGASGAAAFYRRAMLEEVRAGNQYFDEAFFAYREDADLAWRAQWLGWSCLYVPEARGYHVRRVLPERRSRLPADINMHSFKNRFLMRAKNMDLGMYARFLWPITARDALALGYVVLREQGTLRCVPLLLRSLPQAWRVREALRRHRRVSPAEMRRWFSWHPVSRPAPHIIHP